MGEGMKLYPDQDELVTQTRAAMTRSKSVLMVSPTGSGKTAMATHIIKSAQDRGRRILFSVPRRDLMEQTSETFERLGINHSFVAAGKPYNPFAQVYIGMVDSMARRIGKLPPIDLLINDEVHFGLTALDSVIQNYKAQGSYVLGLSASPWKSSGKGLGCWFDNMVVGKSTRWLIDNKRLSDFKYFVGRTKPDLSGIGLTAGDYNTRQLADYMEHQGAIIGDCVTDYKLRCMGKLHLVRCASIKHSQMMAASFQDAGLNFVHVDCETPSDQRKQIFRAYARREIMGLSFVDILGMGFDLSQASGGMDVCVESISDTKPTKSLSSMLQYWGRGLRYKPYPAMINDHVGNFIENGFPDTEREWQLEDREQGKRATGDRALPVKQCPSCFFCHRPAPICPNCGAIYEINSREIDEVAGELHEMSKEQREAIRMEGIKERKKEQGMARTYEELLALGIKRKMDKPAAWAHMIINSRRKYGKA